MPDVVLIATDRGNCQLFLRRGEPGRKVGMMRDRFRRACPGPVRTTGGYQVNNATITAVDASQTALGTIASNTTT